MLAKARLGGQEEQQRSVMLHAAETQLGQYLTHMHIHAIETSILLCSSVSTVPSHC